jgi:Tol biopolymer transport system component
MLTGKKAFPGEDVTEIIASVLKSEPDWAALPANTPGNIRFVLKHCLERDPKRRFHSAADVLIQMIETTSAPSAAALPASVSNRKKLMILGLSAVAACILIGIAVWKLQLQPSPAAPVVTTFTVPLPPNRTLALPGATTTTQCSTMALSPDGSMLAYGVSAGAGHPAELYVRYMNNLAATLIPGSEGVSAGPLYSPDGNWLAFAAESKLKKISRGGGGATTVASVGQRCWTGAAWTADDDILFADQGGLYRIAGTGGTPPQIFLPSDITKGTYNPIMPEFLPGDRAILFSRQPFQGVSPRRDDDEIMVRNLDTGEQSVLIQGGTSPHYTVTGHLLFVRAGTIMAVPFNLKRLQIAGRPVAVVEGLARTVPGISQFSVSRNGTLAYISGAQLGEGARTLVWVDRKGTVQPIEAPSRAYAQPQLSPDGRQIAVTVENPKNDVWIYELGRGTLTRLTFEGNNNSRPLWTPDGKRILFRSDRPGPGNNLFMKVADGTGPDEQITTFVMNLPSSISPDGKLAFFYKTDAKTGPDIWTVPLEGDRQPKIVLQTQFAEKAAMISPDGKFLAYQSDESGRGEIYVRSFPGPGGKWQISVAGGTEPLWSRNGRELFYRDSDKMMAVDITLGQAFKAGTPHMLFEGKYETRPAASETNYDISPDGQRFLMIKASPQPEATAQLRVVTNWFEELKQRVPVK